jgi:hypothetical protein
MSADVIPATQIKTNYQPITGHQLLATPLEFIWKVVAGKDLCRS